jgi:hypothetical protein
MQIISLRLIKKKDWSMLLPAQLSVAEVAVLGKGKRT